MPYIGNNIRAADDYRLIDDISSSFNGSTTSFALQIAGSSPVPFPKSPQQCLISVNGVIQEPDPTGASGFNLSGTNIVFSSAPTNGHSFFGIVYATADYLNAGGTFPAGSTGSPSITFTTDQDTGLYRKGSGSIGFVSNSTEIANVDSNGITSTQFIGGGASITGIAAGTPETIFTANSNDTIVGISVANVASATINVSVYITSGGNDIHLIKDTPIVQGSALQIIDGGARFVLQNADALKVQSDTASSADVWVSAVDDIST